jgi:hypothetical protein
MPKRMAADGSDTAQFDYYAACNGKVVKKIEASSAIIKIHY